MESEKWIWPFASVHWTTSPANDAVTSEHSATMKALKHTLYIFTPLVHNALLTAENPARGMWSEKTLAEDGLPTKHKAITE